MRWGVFPYNEAPITAEKLPTPGMLHSARHGDALPRPAVAGASENVRCPNFRSPIQALPGVGELPSAEITLNVPVFYCDDILTKPAASLSLDAGKRVRTPLFAPTSSRKLPSIQSQPLILSTFSVFSRPIDLRILRESAPLSSNGTVGQDDPVKDA